MKRQNHIVSNDNLIVGKPAIKGTRIAVEFIIDRLADGWTEEDILSNYPNLTRNDFLAVFAYLSDSIKDGLLLKQQSMK
jgi:uncharacterized protein (DUF433 family)